MQTKSKEWIARLIVAITAIINPTPAAVEPFDADGNRPEPIDPQATYAELVNGLMNECRELILGRLGRIDTDGLGLGLDTKIVAAFREGAVKWDAVRHGVSLKVAEVLDPLVRGALLLPFLDEALENLTNKTVTVDSQRATIRSYHRVADELGWANESVIHDRFVQLDQLMCGADIEELRAYIKAVKDVDMMTRKKAKGSIHKSQEPRLAAMDKWVRSSHRAMVLKFNDLPKAARDELRLELDAAWAELQATAILGDAPAKTAAPRKDERPAKKKFRNKNKNRKANNPAQAEAIAA